MRTLADRIRLIRGDLSQAEFAARSGINANTLRAYEKGRTSPSADTIACICTIFDVLPEWFLFGTGPIKKDGEGGSEDNLRPCSLAMEGEDCDLVMVPKVRARLSAGTGSLETSNEIDGRYAFRSSWLRSKGQVNRMVLMDIAGDSMEPDIRDRDMVLIDQAQQDAIPGAIYAIGVDDGVLIKYLDMKPGRLVLRSANKGYEPMEIDLKDESLNVRIIGRVVWWCREAR